MYESSAVLKKFTKKNFLNAKEKYQSLNLEICDINKIIKNVWGDEIIDSNLYDEDKLAEKEALDYYNNILYKKY